MIWYRFPYWIFDMDGTLTVAVHDFQAIKQELGLPQDKGILEALEIMDPAEARPIHKVLDEIEWELAGKAQAAKGAKALLTALKRAGANIGILTRNTKRNALRTLEAAGLRSFFEEDDILGRLDAPPKPHPEGLIHLLDVWGGRPEQAVMVGDYVHDLEAAKRGGLYAVYIDPKGEFPYADHADQAITQLDELLPFPVKTDA